MIARFVGPGLLEPEHRAAVVGEVELALGLGDEHAVTVNTAGTLYHRTGAYSLINLTLSYAFTDQLSVQLGGRNLSDFDYQLVDGFPEPGRSLFVALKARY